MNQANKFASYPSLRDRVVLVTGGGSGIGASIVELFALQGARVAFLEIAEDAAKQVVESLSGKCVHAPVFVHCDLTDIVGLRAAVAEIKSRLGTVQVLVNNAANDDRHRMADVTPEYWDNRMNVNLRHQFFAIQAVAPRMIEAGAGSIINMSSISWVIATTGASAYVSAKAAIVGMTRTMARELGPAGIRVNCVLPGAINTERQIRLWMTPEYSAEILARQCLKRHIMPEEVARLVLFLAADDSGAITNQGYVIDAGWV
jgi:NAD(P)-dependent dehydrogenase (short-subunit alcohol dehydrogenase family)